ncbi:helix-turn-helix domain-containing protein [Halobellus rufus]|uniref:helix-turn-helix domain-containing protein n=1 Tax=Halobellus rufus TaxID=1448860 RepID=UPI000679A44B|nr:helix-turn-helix domain-containing protein [Halobellus rufus]
MTDEKLPPSAKYVKYVLEDADQPLTTTEIADETDLPLRTTRRAIDRLRELGYLHTLPPAGIPRYETPSHRIVEPIENG